VFLSDTTVETWNLVHLIGDCGGHRHFFLFAFGHIEIFDAIDAELQTFECFLAFLLGEIGFKNFVFVQK
jgi:hypothetical protein